MRANEIRLYDLDAVNTTIVLREIQPNPDVITIGLYDLDPVSTTIVLRQIPPPATTAVNAGVQPDFGQISVNGFAPLVAIGLNAYANVGLLTINGHSPTLAISANINPGVGEITVIGASPSVVGFVEFSRLRISSYNTKFKVNRPKQHPGKFGSTTKYKWSGRGYGVYKRK